jgi:hypothetical protein
MAAGFVYVLTNKAMPGLVKIGFSTRSPEERAVELSTTGVPFPFVVAFSAEVENAVEAEAATHLALTEHRVSSAREFFRISVESAVSAIENCCGLSSSPFVSECDLSPWSSNINSSYYKETQKYYPKSVSFSVASEPQTWFPPHNIHTLKRGEVLCPYCAHRFEETVFESSMYLPPLTAKCPSCYRTFFLR